MKTMNTHFLKYFSDRSAGRTARAITFLIKARSPCPTLFTSVLLLFFTAACQMYSDPLIRPDYEPSLAIHAILSPQEGGQAYIKYSRPIDTSGNWGIPDLPELSLFLYEDGEKKKAFTKKGDGHYILEKGNPEVFPDREYHIMAEDESGQMIFQSEKECLPALPQIRNIRFYQDSTTFPEKNYIDLDMDFLPQPGTALHFRRDYSIDEGKVFIQGREEEYGRFSIRELYFTKDYPEGKIRKTLRASTFMQVPPNEKNESIDATRLWVDHLSPALTRFLREVLDLDEAQSDPFAVRGPVYSNIDGGQGIFGLYNSFVEDILLE